MQQGTKPTSTTKDSKYSKQLRGVTPLMTFEEGSFVEVGLVPNNYFA
jgi:hypothetical protein